METGRDPKKYEYRFETTPKFLQIDEEVLKGVALPEWELHDVFLKYLDNGSFVFVPVFRRITNLPKALGIIK